MKKILLIGHDGEKRLPYENSSAWTAFARILEASGFRIADEYSEDLYGIIANSHQLNCLDKKQFLNIEYSRRVLIIWEPYVVEREIYEEHFLRNFKHIFAPSKIWAARVSGTSFNWPQDSSPDDPHLFENWTSRLERIVVIQGNKFSARKGELYSLRRKVISKVQSTKLDLYGNDWNAGVIFDCRRWFNSLVNSKMSEISYGSLFGVGYSYLNYQGPSVNKRETLTKYQVSLVIENSADFVSEKLFDSIKAGCLTIYVGTNLEDFGLPKNLAIQIGHSDRAILEALESILSLEDSERLEMVKAQFSLMSSSLVHWENTRVLSKLAHDVVLRIAQ